jgi:hypothetical protein
VNTSGVGDECGRDGRFVVVRGVDIFVEIDAHVSGFLVAVGWLGITVSAVGGTGAARDAFVVPVEVFLVLAAGADFREVGSLGHGEIGDAL